MTLRRAIPFWARKKSGGGSLGYLDSYPGALMAHSTRKVYSAYSGPCMQITTDNVTFQDIAFDGSGNLDITAIASFCGANVGKISTFYDQSGNSIDLVQPTLSIMPDIYDGSSVITQFGVPTPKFDAGGFWVNPKPVFITLDHHFIYFIHTTSSVTSIMGHESNSSTSFALASQQGSGSTGIRAKWTVSNLYKNKSIVTPSTRGDVFNLLLNGSIIIQRDSRTTDTGGAYYVGSVQFTSVFKGNMNDLIWMPSSFSLTDLESISDLINNAYGLY